MKAQPIRCQREPKVLPSVVLNTNASVPMVTWRSMWQTLRTLPNPWSLSPNEVYAAISYAMAILDASHPEAACAARKAIDEGQADG